MKKYETFGQTLTRLMQERECTVRELTQHMSLKSTNTIARLLAERSSPNKIRSFCDQLLQENPLQLVEQEKEQLRESVAVSEVGLNLYTANKSMLYFVQERSQAAACVCKEAYGEGSFFISTLDELLQSYTEFESVSIVLQNCALGGVTRAVRGLLEHAGNTHVTVEQYVNAGEDRALEVLDFINLLDVMGHPDYRFFYSPHRYTGGHDFHNVYGNILVALKCDRAGNHCTDLVTFHAPGSFTALCNIPGEDSYRFHQCQFQALRQQHNPVKAVRSSRFDLNGMIDYTRNLLEMDKKYPLLSIRPDVSLCMIPPDIIQDTLDWYFAQNPGESRALCDAYMEIVQRRYGLFKNAEMRQRYLFSKAGLYRFCRQGQSKANVFGMRDLRPDETQRVLQGILETAKAGGGSSFHLLKNELRYNNTTYLLYGGETLLIDNYPGFHNYDAAKSYHSCWVHTPYITESFSSFAENDLLPHYVCSEQETIEFLESLL